MSVPWHLVPASFTNGATIPYILKALRIFRGEGDNVSAIDCRLEIRYLLSMMCDEPAPPQYVGLEICPTLDAIVVCVDKPRTRHHPRIPSSIPSGRGLHHVIGFTGNLDSLAVHLWAEHEEPILSRNFSRDLVESSEHTEYEWSPFTGRQQLGDPGRFGISHLQCLFLVYESHANNRIAGRLYV
jgi:hypothetical protein